MNHPKPALPSVLDLGGKWDLNWLGGPHETPSYAPGTTIVGNVPGQVHTDLMAAGLLNDPDVGLREAEQMWIGMSQWRYARTFLWNGGREGARVELVAEGLDTLATILLNGEEVARTDDQHIGYRWNVEPYITEGQNLLEVIFDSVWEATEERREVTGELPRPYDEPYPYIRKSACNFGWDWGPHYVTAGIWQAIRLESWQDVRIESIRPSVVLTDNQAHVTVNVSLDRQDSCGQVSATAYLVAPDGHEVAHLSVPVSSDEAAIELHVPEPQLWWPVGMGEQPLYKLVVTVESRGVAVAAGERRIGLRTVAVEEKPDSIGSTWALVVNGQRVRVRGYNWIPDDPFISEVNDERIAQRLDQAIDGGANLLRIWGGGYFSTEAFMSGCDERGLMVWHDFLFACAAYDESESTVRNVRREAEQAVARLSSHPSLAIWCGGNECVWGMYDWGWPKILQGRPYGAQYYTEVLPDVIRRLDPTTPYVPNSPWSGSLEKHPNGRDSGPVHIWEVWNDIDYVHYRDVNPPFVSEMGWCAPPAWSTLSRVITEGEILPTNPQVAHHMRAMGGMEKLARGLEPYFGAPHRPEDWHYLTQIVQARSQAVGAEWLRTRERCAGVVIWQLNDCWPVMSWSAVDGDGIEKPVWYSLRKSFAQRMLTIVPVTAGGTDDPTGPDGLEIVVVNDGITAWTPEITVRRVNLNGEESLRTSLVLSAAPDGTARAYLPAEFAATENGSNEFLVADADGLRATWFFRPDAQLTPAAPEFSTNHEIVDGSLHVTVKAQSVLRDLCLFADRLSQVLDTDASQLFVDDMMKTVLPGEEAKFIVSRRDGEPIIASSDLGPALSYPALRAIGDGDAGTHPSAAGVQDVVEVGAQ